MSLAFWAGFVFYAFSFLLFLYVLSRERMNYAFPLMAGAGYLGAIMVSYFLLHEPLDWRSIIAIMLIGIGIILLEAGHN